MKTGLKQGGRDRRREGEKGGVCAEYSRVRGLGEVKQQIEWSRQHGCLWAVTGQTHCQREQWRRGVKTGGRGKGDEKAER